MKISFVLPIIANAISLQTKLIREIDDLLVTVKSTRKNYNNRVQLLLDTWHTEALERTFIVTDAFDAGLNKKLGGKLIATNCNNDHSRGALSCKQEAELQLMFQYKARWSCHFDDDTFVNYGQLRKTLESYDETKEIYLGRRSVAKPISISYSYEDNHKQSSFVFGTGGAGWCISRPLLIKIEKVLSETTFSDISNQIRLPDDVTVGFVVNELLKIELTNDDHFNSHLTNLASLDPTQQVTVSYSPDAFAGRGENLIRMMGTDSRHDPTRLIKLARVIGQV